MFRIERPFRIIRSNYQIFNKRNELVGYIKQINYFFGAQFQLLDRNKNKISELKYQPFSSGNIKKVGFPIDIVQEDNIIAKIDIPGNIKNLKFAISDAIDLIIEFNSNDEDLRILSLALVLAFSLQAERKRR